MLIWKTVRFEKHLWFGHRKVSSHSGVFAFVLQDYVAVAACEQMLVSISRWLARFCTSYAKC